ncbi:condensation domain-containing protein, partial [Rhodococcus sp. NPDC057014]|uniref:condensation domain-containing protein n=1 Tax=Rhodococcus sp. NPDC057014 TaxID=3346000 RepID=UPI003627A70A
SIMSIQLVTRAKASGVVITPRDVFERKTVAALAEVATSGEETITLEELPGGGVGEFPLTPIVRWMLGRDGDFRRYSQAALFTTPAELDEDTLTAAMQAVLDRHDMLRARLYRSDRWIMATAPPGWVRATEVVRTVPLAAADSFPDAASRELDAAAGRLDPESGVMVQAVWFASTAEPAAGRLLIVAHHAVVDGVSWRILVPDLALACARVLSGEAPALPDTGTSMRTWAHALTDVAQERSRTAELGLWRRMLDTPDPPLGARPLTPADVQTSDVEVQVPVAVTETLLTSLPQAFHGNVADGLLTALALALVQWRRDRGIESSAALVNLEGHGREEHVVPGADLARTVGWFTTIFPVGLDLDRVDVADACAAGPAAGDAVKAVKERLHSIPDHGIGFGLLRYLDDDTARELSAQASPQVSFNYLGRLGAGTAPGGDWMPVSDAGLAAAAHSGLPAAAVVDVNARTTDTAAGPVLTATWSFPVGVIAAADVGELARLWVRALEALAEHTQSGGGGFTP